MRNSVRMMVLVAALAPGVAAAGGFEVPDNGVRAVGRGGANAVGVSDLTAAHYNPGALARLSGPLVVTIDDNLFFHHESFQRAQLDPGWGPPYGGRTFDKVEDDDTLFPIGAFASVGSNFGLEDWMFAASVYGPSAVGQQKWPAYGPQSFLLTEEDILLVYYSLSAAWQKKDTFGFGATLQWVDMPKMQYELVVDADVPGILDPVPERGTATVSSTQLAARLDLKDRFAWTAIVGGWWRPLPYLEIAAAGRIVPIHLEPTGKVHLDRPELSPGGVTVRMPLTLPMQARGGVRYLSDAFDVELDAFWENWSVLDRYNVHMKGQINGLDVHDLIIEKQWSDTVSIRLGGEYHLLPSVLDVRAGGFIENGAAPKNYSHLDFQSFDRLGLGGGLTWHVPGIDLALSAAYMHIFQEDRTVTEAYGKQFQQRPVSPCPDSCGGLSGVVANAGKFESRYDILSLGVDYRY
jgi:long-chain fatty acid transport protein